MTFSIIAYDPITQQIGVAVTTANLAVGAVGYQIKAGVGVVVTQADPHPIFGYRAIELMELGLKPEDILKSLKNLDQYPEKRQIAMVKIDGRSVAWTGQDCVTWANHYSKGNYCVAGNMLVSDDTLLAMDEHYYKKPESSFAERLLITLAEGQKAGGDKRGRQSAALSIYSTELYADIDLRVDDHPEPIKELFRLFEESQKPYYQSFRRPIPTRKNPSGVYEDE